MAAMEPVESPEQKLCRRCCTPIPAAARKCPHCLSWQSAFDLQSPGFVVLMLIPFLLLMLFLAFLPLRELTAASPPLASISIDQPRLFYSARDGSPTVSVLGFLSNTSAVPVENPHFEVRFFDASGDLIDTLSASAYALVIQPRSEAAFRVSGPALRGESEYSRFDIRLTQIARARR
jgi:hypothetical protein